MGERVVVTGLGAISPLGLSPRLLWDGLVAGRSAVRTITRFDPAGYGSQIAAEVDGFDPTDYMERREVRKTDLFTQYALAASSQAFEHAGLSADLLDAERTGVVMGTGIGGLTTLMEQQNVLREQGPSRVSPHFITMIIANIAAGMLAIRLGAMGPNLTVVTACASGAHAIGEAFKLIREGELDVAVAGGSEAPIIPLTVAGFANMRATSSRNHDPAGASRPFDAERDGFVIGEGAAMVVLESERHALARGAEPLAVVAGYGCTADAYHITAPSPQGEGGALAMQRAMEDAGLEPADVDYINAHGTSTPVGDVGETRAIKTVLGDRAAAVPVSSSKSMIGHLLGAAGAAELVACVYTLTQQLVHPTINLEHPDPECDLDYVPGRARPATVRALLSNSFGFGGQNASLALLRWEPDRP